MYYATFLLNRSLRFLLTSVHVRDFVVQERKLGLRLNIIIVAEGAIDRDGKAITGEMVKNVSVCP